MSAQPRAPLRTRLRRRFWPALDYATAAGCALVIYCVLFRPSASPRFPPHPMPSPSWLLVLVLAIGLSFPVAIRRRAPARALAMVLAACLATLAVGGEITRGPFLPLSVVLYLVASTCRRAVAVAGLGAALALLVIQGVALHYSGVGSGNAIGVGLVLTILWMAGYLVQQRRTYLTHLRDRAASDAVTQERLRIARELHDVVAHSMTVVTVQAGFGEYVFDNQPGEARAALGAIQAVSREAQGELQRMLSVLRQTDAEFAPGPGLPGSGPGGPAAGLLGRLRRGRPRPAPAHGGPAGDGAGGREDGGGPAAPLAPAPGLANLDRLVERTAGAGVKVTVERTGRVRALPAGLDLSAFRIVQEALTNVVKHSAADSCQVVLHYGASYLLVKVVDPGRGGPADASPRADLLAGAVARGAGGPALVTGGARAAAPVAAGPQPDAPRPASPHPNGQHAASQQPNGVNAAGQPSGGPAASPVPGAGHGLIGMRERVSLCGGDFIAGPLPDGGFLVRARLPLVGTAS